MEKFPDHIDAATHGNGSGNGHVNGSIGGTTGGGGGGGGSHSYGNGNIYSNGSSKPDRWLSVPRRDPNAAWSQSSSSSVGRHSRQKSLTDAFRTIRGRNGSVSQNAHEIADALRAPVSPKLIVSPLLDLHSCYALHRDRVLCGRDIESGMSLMLCNPDLGPVLNVVHVVRSH